MITGLGQVEISHGPFLLIAMPSGQRLGASRSTGITRVRGLWTSAVMVAAWRDWARKAFRCRRSPMTSSGRLPLACMRWSSR